jgi:hypothetical protein
MKSSVVSSKSKLMQPLLQRIPGFSLLEEADEVQSLMVFSLLTVLSKART